MDEWNGWWSRPEETKVIETTGGDGECPHFHPGCQRRRHSVISYQCEEDLSQKVRSQAALKNEVERMRERVFSSSSIAFGHLLEQSWSCGSALRIGVLGLVFPSKRSPPRRGVGARFVHTRRIKQGVVRCRSLQVNVQPYFYRQLKTKLCGMGVLVQC